MKRILAISGSRADYGLLEWPVKVLSASFEVLFERLHEVGVRDAGDAYLCAEWKIKIAKPDCILILGDRWEILAAAMAAHIARVPIAHIGGGDFTPYSYDDAMRDCISRLATWHFATSAIAADNLKDGLRYENVYMVGNPGIDYIKHGDWKRDRMFIDPYVVVSYQAETIDGVIEWDKVLKAVKGRRTIWMMPNKDNGSDEIRKLIKKSTKVLRDLTSEAMTHAEFLNLIYHCDEFIGNSSSMLYEAPELGVKTRMIGKRQQGRVIPWGDGKASERIREVLCRCL